MSGENPYQSPQTPLITPLAPRVSSPTGFYRLWLGLAMLISLTQLRFRGVYSALEVELPELTLWAMRPTVPLVVLCFGVMLAQVARRLRTDHRAWLNWTSVVMVATLCLAFGISLYLPFITIQRTLD